MRYCLFSMILLLNFLYACHSAISQNSDIPNGKKYLALGDSYTIGESVSSKVTYPQQLVDVLNQNGAVFKAPEIIAQTGWTTANLKNAIQRAGIAGNKYDLVSLLIGVNNEFQGRSLSEFEKEFTALLDQAIGFANNKESVFVLSIPDYGFTPFGKDRQAEISARIDQFNTVLSKVCNEKEIKYLEITSISRKGLKHPELVARDGLHPSGMMYAEFVKLIVKSMH